MSCASVLRLWRRSSLLLFFFFALAQPTLADEGDFLNQVTFNKEYPPGSLIVKYGGVRGRISDEISKRLIDLWDSQVFLTNPDPFEYVRERQKMKDAYHDMRSGGQWWTRKWMWSLEEENGGAPNTPVRVTKGLSHDLIRLGPFYINNKFKFKLRQYDVKLTGPKAIHKWELKIKPKLKLDIGDYVRNARVAIQFIYSKRNVRLIGIEIYSGYRVRRGMILGIQISMLRW